MHIAIQGQALSAGGVALSASHVTLGSGATPALYEGRIVQLSGNRILATVRGAGGRGLSLDITLQSTPGASSVSGTVAASPVQASGSE
jgi:hypothetical protein